MALESGIGAGGFGRGTEVIAKPDAVLEMASGYHEMDMMCPPAGRIAFDEPGEPVRIRAPEEFITVRGEDRRNLFLHPTERGSFDKNVDDGLRREARDGGRADMLDPAMKPGRQERPEGAGFGLKKRRPCRVVFGKLHRLGKGACHVIGLAGQGGYSSTASGMIESQCGAGKWRGRESHQRTRKRPELEHLTLFRGLGIAFGGGARRGAGVEEA